MAWGMTERKDKMLELIAATKRTAELREEINAEMESPEIIACRVECNDKVEIHVMDELEDIAKMFGKDIDVKQRVCNALGHEYSIEVLGVKISQLGR